MTEKIKQILPDIKNHALFIDYDFRLIGGTALSYHLNHRLSEDLDFCLMGKLPLDAIEEFIKHSVIIYGRDKVTLIEFSQGKLIDFEINCENIFEYEQNWMINGVKVTFFDGSDNRGIKDIFEQDKYSKIGNIKISSVDSIFAMKSLMFYKRAKSRDYYDLFYMYKYDATKYSIQKTVSLIQKYELSYREEQGFKQLFHKVEHANYSKMYDEPLMGLVEEVEEFPVLNTKMIGLLKAYKDSY